MNIDNIFSTLNLVNLYLPLITLLIPLIFKIFKVFHVDDMDLNKKSRNFKKLLKSTVNVFFIFLFILLFLFTLSIQFIQTHNNEWESIPNKDDIYITALLFYSFVSIILALYAFLIFSNFKTEIYLILKKSYTQRKYKIISKINEQNMVIIKYQDPNKLDTIYEKAFDIKEEALIFQHASENIILQDLDFIKSKSPRRLRVSLMLLIKIIIIFSLFYTFEIFFGYIELSSFTNSFSWSLLTICIIISLTSIIPIILGIVLLKKAYKYRWYK